MPLHRVATSLTIAGGVLGGCSWVVPPTMSVAVHESVLGSGSTRPIWEWELDGYGAVGSFRYSLDGGTWTEVARDVMSFRPAEELSDGLHELEVQARVGPLSGFRVGAAAAVQVTGPAAHTPDDACYVTFAPCNPFPFSVSAPTGPDEGQWNMAEVGMPDVWRSLADTPGLQGRQQVVVAVLDTGYTAHPDIIGAIDTTIDFDFFGSNANSQDDYDDDATDDGDAWPEAGVPTNTWHGTGVSGVIAAATDDATGLAGAGLVGDIVLMPVRVLGKGGGTTYIITQGILYAIGDTSNIAGLAPARTADVINLSLGGGPSDAILDAALQQAVDAGVLVVAAAGNHALGGSAAVTYPGSSVLTIAVGAVTRDRGIADYSNTGSEVDIVAPGGDAQNTSPIPIPMPDPAKSQPLAAGDYGYSWSAGTSIATPHVTAALALLRTIAPTLRQTDALTVLADSVDDLGIQGHDTEFGFGFLDAHAMFGSYPLRASAATPPRAAPAVTEQAQPLSSAAVASASNVIVRLTPGSGAIGPVAVTAMARAAGAGAVRGSGRIRLVDLGGADRELTMRLLADDPRVESVHPNYVYQPL